MKEFLKVVTYDKEEGKSVERWFNARYVRHIEPETNRIMLQGAKTPITCTSQSMEELMREVECVTYRRDVLPSINYDEKLISMVSDVLYEVRTPWYKRLYNWFSGRK